MQNDLRIPAPLRYGVYSDCRLRGRPHYRDPQFSPYLSRKQETTRGVPDLGGSFIGGGGSREATADEVAEYLARSPHWAHLMRLTLEMGWKDVHLSLAKR
jgi:hypothetical protein